VATSEGGHTGDEKRSTSEGAGGARNLSPRNLSQDDLLDMGSVNHYIALGNKHCTNIPMANAVIHPVTGKKMKYMDLMKYTTIQPLWKRGFGNELGRLFQGIWNIQGTHTLVSLSS
jgi:hypothetical protein